MRDAFLHVPRELFVPEFAAAEGLEAVYRDDAILTKRNAYGAPLSSSSQPAIMAAMLEQLELEQGMSVLEVGAGTGYNAAVLSLLTGPRGRVVSIDVDPQIARAARRNLRAGGYRARVVAGDGRRGFAGAAPYDRIVVTASSPTVAAAWFEQLRPGGLLEVPLRLSRGGAQAIPALRKTAGGFRSTAVLTGGFMPLRDAGDDGAAGLRRRLLIASETTEDGSASLQQLEGEAIATLSARAKRRLLAVSLTDGRRRPLGLRADADALLLYLSLRVPPRRLVMTGPPRFGLGTISRSGSSLAVIAAPAGRRTVESLQAFGDDEAEQLLLDDVRDWDRRGRPSASALAITTRYEPGSASRPRHRWPPRPRR